jgi:hypothetical protein
MLTTRAAPLPEQRSLFTRGTTYAAPRRRVHEPILIERLGWRRYRVVGSQPIHAADRRLPPPVRNRIPRSAWGPNVVPFPRSVR